jgi:hypothetical protein
VVANEYSLYSESAQAKALGDRLCAEGAVGTGNGRNIVFCGQVSQKEKTNYGAIGLGAVAIASIFMVSKGFPVTMNYNGDLSVDYNPHKGFGFKAEEERVFITHRWEF